MDEQTKEKLSGAKEEAEKESERPEMKMVQAAASTQIFAKLLEEYYAPMELWHLKNSIDKVLPIIIPFSTLC